MTSWQQCLKGVRHHYRMQCYQEFVTFWHQVQEQGIWGRLEQTLNAAVENTENAAAVAREGTPITSH
jgi:hypothetical protein